MIALIPSLALLALGVGGASYLVVQGTSAKDYASKLREVIPPSIVFLNNLREERRVTMLAMAGDPQAAAQLGPQRAATDQTVANIAQIADQVTTLNPAGMAKVMPVLGQFLAQMPDLRKKADANQVSELDVANYYSGITGVLALAMPELARTSPDSSAAVDESLSADIGVAADEMSTANSIGIAAMTAGGLTVDEWRAFRHHVEGYHALLEQITDRLPDQSKNDLAALTKSEAWQKVVTVENTLVDRGPRPSATARDTRPIPVATADWQNSAHQVTDALADLWGKQHGNANATIVANGQRTLVSSLLGGAAILVVTALAMVIAIRLSNKLINRLKRLRQQTLMIADEALPMLVNRLREGRHVDIGDELSTLDFGRDEIGQVADAFNKAQRTATGAAAQEAKTRAGVNAVFLNIAHRSQVVVHRQLEVLDQAERREEDPDQLELLFKLDHLATRSRRNAENLIILGGQQPGRQWRNPVPLMEVVRSAVAETEDYARVRTGRLPAVSMVGAVVADLVHLLAELVDNATSFSPPESRVEVRGNVVGTGIVVEIEDQGLGITKEERERINESLHETPDFEVMSLSGDARLGLFVVARLSARHGISVTLAESAYGGTRAIVLIRQNLIAPVERNDDNTENAGEVTDIAALRTPRPRIPSGDGIFTGEGIFDRDRVPHVNGVPRAGYGGDGAGYGESAPNDGYGDSDGNGRSLFEPAPRTAPVDWPREDEAAEPPSPSPRHAAQTVTPADGRPPLPRRRRQASLAPQLAAEVNTPTVSEERPPEQARDTMAAFQRGTRQARDNE